MKTLEFNNQPTTRVSKEIIFDLFNQLDLTWHGMMEFGRYEQELIEDELNVAIEIQFKNDVKRTAKNLDNIDNYNVIFHDNNFDWDKEEAEEEEIVFDDETKNLIINDIEFVVSAFDENEFVNIIEKPSKEYLAYQEARKTMTKKQFIEKVQSKEIVRQESKLSIFLSSWQIYFDGRLQKDLHPFFKGKEQNILKAIQNGKEQNILNHNLD